MSAWDQLVGVGTALGKGVISVGADLYYGVGRTAEGLGVSGWDRSREIGFENEYLVKNLVKMVKGGITARDSPLYKIISTILEAYFEKFPEEALKKVAQQALGAGAYMAGRMVIGKMLAQKIAVEILTRLAATTAFKQFAAKLGVSAAAGSTGVGIIITLVMVQGVGQRASHASKRLRQHSPALWQDLRRQEGLDMLYFLVEEPMAKHMELIRLAHQNRPLVEQQIRRMYQEAHGR